MNGGPSPKSQSPDARPPEPRLAHLHALGSFTGDPEREPLDFGDDDNGAPVDNLAASVGILSAVAIGLLLWVIILLLVLWLK